MNNNKIVYDLETKKTFGEVGGLQSRHHLLGVAYVGVYSYSQGKYFGFLEKDLKTLELILLKQRPKIIGFNSKSFDNKVIQPYFKNLDINSLPQLDILEEISRELGFRVKLESVAQATLGEGKSGTGLDAVRYYKEKNFDALAKYCLDDVRITKDLYEYGRRHGKIYYFSGGEKIAIKVSWGESPTITDIVQQSFAKYKRLKIKYFLINDKGLKQTEVDTEIDILKLRGDQIVAYCHTKDKEIELNIAQILEAEQQDYTYAHQTSLI